MKASCVWMPGAPTKVENRSRAIRCPWSLCSSPNLSKRVAQTGSSSDSNSCSGSWSVGANRSCLP